jgi:hypothetical protein
MYASDMIYMIFKNIQEEFSISRAKYIRAETHLKKNQAPEARREEEASPKPVRKSDPAKVSRAKTYFWMGAAAALIGAGVAVYVIADGEPAKATNHEVK